MLDQISKLDKDWRKIATKICNNKFEADDIVNDMYIKMHERQPKTFNVSYISYCMYHIWLNKIKKNKTFEGKNKIVYLEEIDYNKFEENLILEDRIKINNILNEIGLLDREILLHTHERSLRKTADILDMNYGKVNYKKNIAFDKLLQTDGIKNWINER